MSGKALKRLETLVRSIWLYNLQRGLISSGALRRSIEKDGSQGITLNPSVFENVIADSRCYLKTLGSWHSSSSADPIYGKTR